MKPKRQPKTVKDFKDFQVAERFGEKPLTGADPVLLDMIKKAAKK